MNTEHQSLATPKVIKPIQIDLDEFDISEDTFKPMTKGLGFHQENKKQSFKPAPKETKTFASPKLPVANALSKSNLQSIDKKNKTATSALPTGLEAFYGKAPAVKKEIEPELSSLIDSKIDELVKIEKNLSAAPQLLQLFAWAIDILVVSSFVVLTATLLVLASGIEFKMYEKLINNQELFIFGAALFSIYYIMYFTILDLNASPGKTIMGIRLARVDKGELSVKHTFTRALISLMSGIALFLPMLLDFQGRLSDTKLVK